MVVFEGGAPKKADYRRFAIRDSVQDDFAAMAEVLSRRMAQYVKQRERSPHDKEYDESFASLPGADRDRRRQGPALGRARASSATFRDLGVTVVTLAKRDRGGLRARAAATRCGSPTTRPSCSCSSASATRRTASRSSSTAAAATRR